MYTRQLLGAQSLGSAQLSQDPALQGVQLWLLGYLTLCGPELPPLPPHHFHICPLGRGNI